MNTRLRTFFPKLLPPGRKNFPDDSSEHCIISRSRAAVRETRKKIPITASTRNFSPPSFFRKKYSQLISEKTGFPTLAEREFESRKEAKLDSSLIMLMRFVSDSHSTLANAAKSNSPGIGNFPISGG